MVPVIDQTVGAERVADAVEAEQVAFALVGIAVNRAGDEVVGPQHRGEPRRTRFSAPRVHDRTHLTKHRASRVNESEPSPIAQPHGRAKPAGNWEQKWNSTMSMRAPIQELGFPIGFCGAAEMARLMGLVCLDGNREKRLMGTEGEL